LYHKFYGERDRSAAHLADGNVADLCGAIGAVRVEICAVEPHAAGIVNRDWRPLHRTLGRRRIGTATVQTVVSVSDPVVRFTRDDTRTGGGRGPALCILFALCRFLFRRAAGVSPGGRGFAYRLRCRTLAGRRKRSAAYVTLEECKPGTPPIPARRELMTLPVFPADG